SFGASNEPPGEVSKIAYQSWTPCRARLRPRPSASPSPNRNAANAAGRSARAARGATSAPAASVTPDRAARGDTRGDHAMTNGGRSVPSLPVAALIESPATTVAAAPKVTIRETSGAADQNAERGWDARCMTARIALAMTVLAVLAAGCGSESVHQLPPAAEPPQSPPATAQPAGRVTAVGSQPEGVVAARGRVAVALRNPDRLAIVDGGSGAVLKDVPLPGAARHLALASSRGPVLVPLEDANSLLAVSLSGRVVASVAAGDHPHDAASAAGAWFVGDEGGNRVSVVRAGHPAGGFPVAT